MVMNFASHHKAIRVGICFVTQRTEAVVRLRAPEVSVILMSFLLHET